MDGMRPGALDKNPDSPLKHSKIHVKANGYAMFYGIGSAKEQNGNGK